MRIAGLVQDSIVDGPGLRLAVFTQGCPHRCEGCHNPETHDENGGIEIPVEEIVGKMRANPLTDGVTLSGGEPFSQADDCAEIAEAAKKEGLSVWAYTGYTFEELLQSGDRHIRNLLALTDVLVDGPYVESERSLNLKWRGSRNQRLIDVPKSLAEGNTVIIE